MASQAYKAGRQKYARPQAMLWSNNAPQILSNEYVPMGFEVGSTTPTNASLSNDFIILSDHNRQPLDFKNNRIETRKRMVNGQMRAYHVADKLQINTSWDLLPSRGFATNPNFDYTTGNTALTQSDQFTVDGGAGGVEMLEWYENHTGSFWVYLSYDKYTEFAPEDEFRYRRLGQYAYAVKMFISSFDYSVSKRGNAGHDLWNIQISLEEE
jgi:hypothetical protein